jgi:hypothetical protein
LRLSFVINVYVTVSLVIASGNGTEYANTVNAIPLGVFAKEFSQQGYVERCVFHKYQYRKYLRLNE